MSEKNYVVIDNIAEQPQDKKYVKLNTNESPFPPSPIALMLARQAAGDNQLYSDPDLRELTLAAAEKFNVEADEVIFTNGSDEILNFAFIAFCEGETVFPDVTYGFYPVFAEINQIPYEEIPLKSDFTINVDDYCGINKNIFIIHHTKKRHVNRKPERRVVLLLELKTQNLIS